MKCTACGAEVEYAVQCQQCNSVYCMDHIDQHACQNPRPTQTRINFQPGAFYRPPVQRQTVQRPPTKDEYELYLRSNPQVLTTGRESVDLMGAMLMIAFVFGFQPILTGSRTINYVILLVLVISPAFILHEMGHKYAAIYYKKYARFTLIRQMFFITFLVGLIGFGIVAPGATMIIGNSTKRESGIFAAAGPAVNFVLAVLSYMTILLTPDAFLSFFQMGLHEILWLSIFINSLLGLFNLIPFGMLDGKKITAWSNEVWILLVILNGYMFYIAI